MNILKKKFNIKIVAIIGHSKAGAEVLIAASRENLIKNKDCCFVSLGGRITFGKPEKRFTKEQLVKCKEEGSFLYEYEGKNGKLNKNLLTKEKI